MTRHSRPYGKNWLCRKKMCIFDSSVTLYTANIQMDENHTKLYEKPTNITMILFEIDTKRLCLKRNDEGIYHST